MADRLPVLYPLTFTPALRDYIWGGRNLERLYGRSLPPGPTAESWEISGHPTASTVVDSGPLRGKPLPEVLDSYGVDLVGTRACWALERSKFPLMIKLLDVEKRLSVQAHPPDDYAMAHEDGELGKTEMWYVLHARPGAHLIMGLRPGVTQATFRQAVADESLEECLNHLPVKAGDAFLISPGTVHAALEGLVIAEVLQNSDTTYRVYDWGRMGTDGQPRPLHLRKAMEVIDFQQDPPGPIVPVLAGTYEGITRYELTRCQYFVVERVSLESGATYAGRTEGKTFEIWGTIDGQARLSWDDGSISLPTIRFCLVPACLGGFSIRSAVPTTMLRVYLP